jgi:DNA-directed RNA polymerase subunit F
MSKPQIISEEPISMYELKSELAKIKKRDGELSFRANRTEDYLNNFVVHTPKIYKELKESLEALNIPRLKEVHILKLLDMQPKSPDEVKIILQGYTITVSQDNCKKIAKVFA